MDTALLDDAALVRQFQQGDMQAFDALYTRYKDDAYRIACLITGNRTDGEDLAQEAFVSCAQSIGSLKDGAKFKPWLLKTLTRAAWKHCRRQQRETPVASWFDTGEQAESALSAALRNDEQRRLFDALERLDEKRRTVVVLYYFEDLSIREIAQMTGVLEGTVKSRLYSARRHLRQALTEQEQKPKEAATHG